jgi:hypothetical protein
MLTLFMMLGAAYLVVATRSRETARAYSKLSLRNDNVRLPHSQIFDTVMLRVLRGVPAGQNVNVAIAQPAPPGVTIAPFESILADKYGGDLADTGGSYTIALSGTAHGAPLPVVEMAPVLVLPQVQLDAIPPADAAGSAFAATDLAGRVITILGTGRDPSSHRILRATATGGGSYKLVVDNQPRNRPYEPVVGNACRIVINGREFSGDGTRARPNESWDGFDDANPFLAWVAPRDLQNETDASKVSVSSSVVKKVGFVQSGTAANVLSLLNSGTNGFSFGADNDNDGVNDGFFLDFGLPTVISPNGDQITLHASVLVLDLDGRVNVNAHGSLVPIVYPHTVMSGTNSNWQLGNLPTGLTAAKLLQVPTGSGYGPSLPLCEFTGGHISNRAAPGDDGARIPVGESVALPPDRGLPKQASRRTIYPGQPVLLERRGFPYFHSSVAAFRGPIRSPSGAALSALTNRAGGNATRKSESGTSAERRSAVLRSTWHSGPQ